MSGKDDVSKRTYPLTEDYIKGASFIEFLISRFGLNQFKEWIKTVHRADFFESLETMSGLTIDEIQTEWKRDVLKGFMDNSLLNHDDRKLPEEQKLTWFENRKQALALYLLHT